MPPRAERDAVPAARTLVLLRHGETDWNAEERAQGHADVPLNERGHAQARAAATAMTGFGAARLWSSDLARAMQTAEHVAAATGLTVEPDVRLREYDVGERSGLTVEEFAASFPQQHAAWLAHEEEPSVPGEETTAQVRDRVVPGLRACLASLEPGETGIVILHGACLQVGLLGLLGWPWELAETLRGLENCAYCVLAEDVRRGRLRLTSYNVKTTAGRFAAPLAPLGPSRARALPSGGRNFVSAPPVE